MCIEMPFSKLNLLPYQFYWGLLLRVSWGGAMLNCSGEMFWKLVWRYMGPGNLTCSLEHRVFILHPHPAPFFHFPSGKSWTGLYGWGAMLKIKWSFLSFWMKAHVGRYLNMDPQRSTNPTSLEIFSRCGILWKKHQSRSHQKTLWGVPFPSPKTVQNQRFYSFT